ncbi:MAG: MotA/TolQ/ExbB proton channel family protein [Candidatus Cloacimonetes bacterium]|jgi:hypothetical protein|nr:MotA/TolQ/ExbB proton channel family protein [Candidatus Cloacimonadota bacterium]MDY0172331.1 MotA/TolQ/ExbB proton channel family protein [Candidatus Cloacimonadaceae bacterium]
MQFVVIALMLLISGLLLAAIVWAITILFKQREGIKNFSLSSYVQERASYYLKMGSVSPSFIENDLRMDLENRLDPDIGLINLIIGSLSILGLLGTFVGLSGSLGLLKDLLNAIGAGTGGGEIGELTGQVAYAFGTSVLGLLGALLLNVCQRFNHKRIDSIFMDSKEQVFSTLMKDGGERTLDLKDLAQSIKTAFIDGINSVNASQDAAFQKFTEWSKDIIKHSADQIFTMVSSNEAKLEAVIEKLNEERKSLDSVKKNWNSAISQLHQSSVNIKSMMQNLNNFAALSEKLIDQIGEFSAAFHTQIALISNLHAQQTQPSEMINQLSMVMSENLNQNKKAYDLNSANQVMIENLVEKIITDVDGLMQGMKDVFEGVNASFNSQLKMIETSTAEGQKQLQGILDLANSRMLKAFTDLAGVSGEQMKNAYKELSKVMGETTDKIGESFPKQENLLTTLNTNTRQLDGNLKRAFEEIINKGITVHYASKRS